jgi:beta-lactamase class D
MGTKLFKCKHDIMAFDKAIKPKQDQDYSGGPKADPETLHKTDPQEHMKGPVSSVMQKIKDGADENEKEDRKKSEDERKSEEER